MPEYFLTAEDLAAIRALVRERKDRVQNTLPTIPDHYGQAPECYIVLVPAEGIPGITGEDGTGTTGPDTGDTPGSALCEVHRIVSGELSPCGFSVTVYNLGDHYVPNGWRLVWRDKFGNWIVAPAYLTNVECVSGSIVATRG